MNVRDVMTPNPRVVQPTESIQSAARIMREEDTGVVPVVESGDRLVGLVTDRDIVVRAVAQGQGASEPVRSIVTPELVVATPDMSTKEATKLMAEHQVRRLPVVDGDRLVGIVSIGDLAVKEGKDSRVGDTLEDISEGVKTRH
jgi:CBS domain-containing protein